ncbi:MAG: hypothetical protein MJZ49_01945 [Bacteroidales bacterium]|nr:hypothetical protein [Bacteroidales bacterium]
MKKIVTFCLLFVASCGQIFAQNKAENARKYELLRERLRMEFMYYTGDGMERGTSLPMERKYVGKSGVTGYWADGTWWQGHYVALLATEYARLKKEGKPTDETLLELRCAIDTYNRLDLAAEHCWNCDTFTQPNGFYLRDDIYRMDTTRMCLNMIYCDRYVNCGNVKAKGNAPSQDQAWGSYLGFALAKKLVNDPELNKKIADIVYRMVTGMQSVGSDGKLHWQVVNPVTKVVIQPETDIQWLQYAHDRIGSMLSGRDVTFKRSDKGEWRSMWNIVQDNMLIDKDGNFRWYGILAMSAVMNDGGTANSDCYRWMVRCCEKIAKKRPDLQQKLIFPHLPLINLALYGTQGRTLVPRAEYDYYLNSAPADGAVTKTIDGKTVRTAVPWHSLSLFCPWHTKDTGWSNMIDYLLLYNLVELIYD